ncbi:hypothetical protein EJ110_NYTH06663 [Nymphaea thermarum]|nr:hypothetical protein EJ110_NYTH06663 [Nymphaea thermarum]
MSRVQAEQKPQVDADFAGISPEGISPSILVGFPSNQVQNLPLDRAEQAFQVPANFDSTKNPPINDRGTDASATDKYTKEQIYAFFAVSTNWYHQIGGTTEQSSGEELISRTPDNLQTMELPYFSSGLATDHYKRHRYQKIAGRTVYSNMITLQKRIRVMRLVDSNYGVADEWMDWEKRYTVWYYSDMFDGVGKFQRFFMSTKPSVAVGILMLVGLSLPTAAVVVLFDLIEACRWNS